MRGVRERYQELQGGALSYIGTRAGGIRRNPTSRQTALCRPGVPALIDMSSNGLCPPSRAKKRLVPQHPLVPQHGGVARHQDVVFNEAFDHSNINILVGYIAALD